MTKDLLTDLGEEYLIKNGLDGISVDVGLYRDSNDQLSDGSDVVDINSEPGNGNYTRNTITFSAGDLSGNWGVDNNSAFTFDFSDTTTTDRVDCAFVVVTFQAADTGDSSQNEHLIANPSLSQSREIGSIDTLEVNASDLQIKLD